MRSCQSLSLWVKFNLQGTSWQNEYTPNVVRLEHGVSEKVWFDFNCLFFQVSCYISKCFATPWYQFHLFDLLDQAQLVVQRWFMIFFSTSLPTGHLHSLEPVGWKKTNILQTSDCRQEHKYMQTQSRILESLFI